MSLKPVYLDFNATTPLSDLVKTEVPQWLEQWGNPSSIHWAGRGPKALLREARKEVGTLIGAHPLEIVFSAGGSEANNLALKGVFSQLALHQSPRRQLIISAVEHPSVKKAAQALVKLGIQVDVVPVNIHGEIDLDVYQSLLGKNTALVSVMYANNETGHIFPVERMAQMARQAGALFHTDAVQALGKVPLNLLELGVDFATLSAHKFYGLKGCGVLYCRKGAQMDSLIHGGGQERGRRAGTENILSIASLGHMAKCAPQIVEQAEHMSQLRDHFEKRVLGEIPGTLVIGQEQRRIPNTSMLIVEDVDGETLLMNMDVRGYAISTGAACSSGNPEPSPVLLAMGFTRGQAQSSLRFSVGWQTTQAEVDAFVEALKEVVIRLRSFRHGEKFAYGI